jgi:murein DD-endopeptidase MepM/ murein hydrolase activator NlpD
MQLPLQNQDQYEKGFLQFRTPYPAGFGSLSGQPHLGTDILTPTGTPLLAMFDGTVRFTTGEQGGKTAILTAINPLKEIPCREFEIRYMHLNRFGKDGQVKAGDVIGFTGNTGQSTAEHLHLDLRPSGTAIHIDNFYDPNTIFELIQKYMTQVPQWFIDNGTDLWAKNKAIRIDQTNLTEADCKELESLKKATQPADIEVTTIITKELSKDELRAYKLSIREVTKFFDGYVNLMFKEPEIRSISLELVKDRLNYLPSKGLNVILYPDKEVDKIKGSNVNGFMVTNQRTTVIAREVLLREDSKHRSEYHYAATLSHELMHWFGTMLDYETRTDRTHHFDYNWTLANYLPKLAWGMLHDKNFRNNNGL